MIGRASRLFIVASLATISAAVALSAGACSNSGNVVRFGGDAGGPLGDGPASTTIRLAALNVLSTGADGSVDASVLVPPFSPDIHDYYVRCNAGTNDLTVEMVAAPGAEAVLVQPEASGPVPKAIIPLAVQENQAIVVAATNGEAMNEFWIRCLPADFPPMRLELHPEAGAPTPGYYLLGTQSGSPNKYAMVVDMNGVPVWYYQVTHDVWSVDEVVDGAISFRQYPGEPYWEIHYLSPLQIQEIVANGNSIDVHDFQAMPNGHFLLFSNQWEGGVDLTGFKLKEDDGGFLELGKNSTIRPCQILEVDTGGTIHWQWNALDHFSPVIDSTYGEYAFPDRGANGLVVPDIFHCNSISIDPANGNLLISGRNMDSVFYIEYPSGKVLWKMGGSSYSKYDAPYVPVPDPFRRQHDARLVPGWSTKCSGMGEISLFDDETPPFASGPARAVVYQVNVGHPLHGETCDPPSATIVWQYPSSAGPSYYMGSHRVLPDGTHAIGWGQNADESLAVTEINPQGADVLDFFFLDNSLSFRAIKVPPSALDLGLLRATAGVSLGDD